MNEPTGIEQLLARDRLIVSGAMLAVFLIAAVYTVMGVGMSMSAVEMTFGASEMPMQDMSSSSSGSSMMEMPSKDMLDGGMSSMMMPPVWSASYAALGLVDGCNVIVLPGISANQIDSEDSGGRYGVSVGSGWSGH